MKKPTLPIAPEPSYRSGHHAALAQGAGFEDDGELCAVTPPMSWDDATEPSDSRGDDAELILGLLRLIVGEHADIGRAGSRAHIIAFLCGASRYRTQAELAAKLNISSGRISQIRQEIQAILPSLGRCNRRQTKTRRTSVRK